MQKVAKATKAKARVRKQGKGKKRQNVVCHSCGKKVNIRVSAGTVSSKSRILEVMHCCT